MSRSLSILVAIAHVPTRTRVIDAIGRHPDLELVESIANARHAVDFIERMEPDVAVVQRRLPIFGSAFILNALRGDELSTRVVVLSGFLSPTETYRAIGAGADAFLPIEASGREICRAITRAADGKVTIPSDMHDRIAIAT